MAINYKLCYHDINLYLISSKFSEVVLVKSRVTLVQKQNAQRIFLLIFIARLNFTMALTFKIKSLENPSR
ncbi:hypothetical protein EAX61_05835 [Dokdonia sinensis]|uniref:Uncharacterized protein n=1 Tax=Dokdonia sinensis TaxID=2479847 RepID=A0A3M0G7L0_9FLAO|nr:hypothetical protein EAX61_05835 [Dokdonia sinensis]